MTKLLVVGGGRMGEALVGGLLSSGWAASPDELAVAEKVPTVREGLTARYPGLRVSAEPVEAEGAVLAVKPVDVRAACEAMAANGTKRVLSIAAGITIATLESLLGEGVAVVRSMPNSPALVGAGAAAIAPGSAATDADLDWAEGLLRAVGTVVRVPEKLLDAVTGVSGSGPAYVFLVVEALIEGGVLAGLPRDVATELAVHTLVGAGKLLVETGETPEVLRAQVTSPGGTTAAGLRALEAGAVRSAFLDAVAAATARATELGRSG